MNKEEILAASRKENKNTDIVDMDCIKQASQIAHIVGCLICITVCILQNIFLETVNWGCWTVLFSILTTMFFVKSIKLNKFHEVLVTILYFSCFIFCAVNFAISLKG